MSSMTNETIAAKQDALAQRLEKMEVKLDSYAGNFITHEVFNLRLKELEIQIKALDVKLTELSRKRWVQNSLSAILGAVLTGLVGYVLLEVFK